MKTTYRYFILSIFITAAAFSYFQPQGGNNDITADDVLTHIKYLASDELGGRFPGTPGDSLAIEYAIGQFSSYGLAPAGDDGFRQRFNFNAGIEMGSGNKLNVKSKKDDMVLEFGKDFTTYGFSSIGEASGELVFCGYGINSADQKYNDFEGIDLKDKIAVIMRYSPAGESNPHDNPFYNNEMPRMKCTLAKDAGAKGIIIVTGPENDDDELAKLRVSASNEVVGIPVVNVKREVIDKLITQQGKNFSDIQKGINSSKKPNSFVLSGCTAAIKTDIKYIPSNTANVIGYLEGTDPVLKNEVIVIGGHMDHLGDGMHYGSMNETGKPVIHNGADDNASGSAGVMEVAQKMASEKNFKRSYLFMLFSGEEAGLLGSSYFVKSELYKKYNIVCMLNMDMIGRMTDNKLIVEGAGTSSIWKHAIDSLNNIKENLNLTFKEEGFGPSDQSSFYSKNMPVLMFFTGLHPDYHRPSDDWDKVNYEGEAKILNLVYLTVVYLDNRTEKPDYVQAKQEKEQTMTGFKVTVGIVPDYSSNAEGLQIMGVKPGGPGEKAGMQAGDVVIKLGARDIKNIYDYTMALGDFKPGDVTEIVVKRGTETLTMKIEFTKK
ncbi:MAG: M28 family peptidase [Ignavibacteriae bacterium]|nr:MAG: M28 family peptidase [Ignavibacteriota bacterium]